MKLLQSIITLLFVSQCLTALVVPTKSSTRSLDLKSFVTNTFESCIETAKRGVPSIVIDHLATKDILNVIANCMVSPDSADLLDDCVLNYFYDASTPNTISKLLRKPETELKKLFPLYQSTPHTEGLIEEHGFAAIALKNTLSTFKTANDIGPKWTGFHIPPLSQLIAIPINAHKCDHIITKHRELEGKRGDDFPAIIINAYVLAASQMVRFIGGDMSTVYELLKKQVERTYHALVCLRKSREDLMLPVAYLKEYVSVFRPLLSNVSPDDSHKMNIVTAYPSVEDVNAVARNGWLNHPSLVLFMTSTSSGGDYKNILSFENDLKRESWNDYLKNDKWDMYMEKAREMDMGYCQRGHARVDRMGGSVCCPRGCLEFTGSELERSITTEKCCRKAAGVSGA